MGQRERILIGLGIIILIVALVMGIDTLRRTLAAPAPAAPAAATFAPDASAPAAPAAGQVPASERTALAVAVKPGDVPIYLNGKLAAAFTPQDIQQLKKVSFVEPVEGKTEEGWLLHDVLLLYLKPDQLKPDTQVTISSSSRKKSAQLTWAQIDDEQNMIMFDLANRGTLKLTSKMEGLLTRDQWVQDVDKIEVGSK